MLGTGLPQKRKSKLWIIHSRASHWERTKIILNKIPSYWINTRGAWMLAAEAGRYPCCRPGSALHCVCDGAIPAAAEQVQEQPHQQTDELPPVAGSTDLCPHPFRRLTVVFASYDTSAYCRYPYKLPVLSVSHSGLMPAGRIGKKTFPRS